MPVNTPAKSRKKQSANPESVLDSILAVMPEQPPHIIERKTVPKDWGYEFWIINTPQYCGKLLIMSEGWESSLHFHKVKDETMLILDGDVVLETKPAGIDGPSEYIMMRSAERTSFRIPPGLIHRLSTSVGADAVIAEFSTTHNEDDVERYTISGPLYESRHKDY